MKYLPALIIWIGMALIIVGLAYAYMQVLNGLFSGMENALGLMVSVR
ncbi:MAG: hypothetical protein PHX10_07425 [Gallionellaceae bacterium]|nr:hypothetical protein [Gallionellaceae bacterium]